MPEPDLEIDLFRPEDVLVNAPVMEQIGSATSQIKGNALRYYRVAAQLRHQVKCFGDNYLIVFDRLTKAMRL